MSPDADSTQLLLRQPPVMTILADAFWRSHFGADSSVIGKTIRVNARSGMPLDPALTLRGDA